MRKLKRQEKYTLILCMLILLTAGLKRKTDIKSRQIRTDIENRAVRRKSEDRKTSKGTDAYTIYGYLSNCPEVYNIETVNFSGERKYKVDIVSDEKGIIPFIKKLDGEEKNIKVEKIVYRGEGEKKGASILLR